MEVIILPAFEDNYIYLLTSGKEAAVVDPGDGPLVMRELERRGLKLADILITHDHQDHVAGVAELQRASGARVTTGGKSVCVLGDDFHILSTPGHSRAHVSFYAPSAGALFSGDTLFCAGCGRLFGNPPEWMFESLRLLAALPDATRVYCGHEYTRDNLRFAAAVEPGNADIAERLRTLAVPSVPSTIGLEKKTNPFVRSRSVEEFAERRRRKDVFG